MSLLRFCRGLDREIGELLRGVGRFCRGLDREIGELLRGVGRFCRGLDREIGELLRGVERFCRGRLGAVFAPKGSMTSKALTSD